MRKAERGDEEERNEDWRERRGRRWERKTEGGRKAGRGRERRGRMGEKEIEKEREEVGVREGEGGERTEREMMLLTTLITLPDMYIVSCGT